MSQSLALLDGVETAPADLTHAHVALPAGWAVAQVYESSPLVITEHWSGLATVFSEPVATDAYADVVRKADAFICVSSHLRRQIADALGEWVLERIEVVPNIVDLSEIRFVRRDTHPFSRWIYVGGLMTHKGVQPLLRAFDEYVKGHDESATLTLVGDGPLRRWIETFAASRGLADAVTVAGTVEHIRLADFLDQANVMVHLSPAETFGIASLEAIGAGLPVVSLRNSGAVGAWGEIEPQCGALLDLESSAADVANAVAALRRAPDGLDLAAGRAFVEEHFSPHVIAERLAGVYRRVLG
jgi:glycogen(starch) synthase